MSDSAPRRPVRRAAVRSAGLLLYRDRAGSVEVLLAHMGGPFWTAKDDGAWTVPKGEYGDAEDAIAAARREFEEELGTPPPDGDYVELGEIRQRGGKVVVAWAAAGQFDVGALRSNEFEIEWPPRSGRRQAFPEVDRAEWFDLETARRKVVAGQAELIERLAAVLAGRAG